MPGSQNNANIDMSSTIQLQAAKLCTEPKTGSALTANCRFCQTPLSQTFVDLGMSPLCESYLTSNELNSMERFYPLHVKVCEKCYLVQVEEYVIPEHIFSEYAYFSSYAETWLKHAADYVEMICQRLGLGDNSLCVELASNDGYLLQYLVKKGIPVIGVEPAVNVAKVAEQEGIPTLVKFSRIRPAQEMVDRGQRADLLLRNNVLPPPPQFNHFLAQIQ